MTGIVTIVCLALAAVAIVLTALRARRDQPVGRTELAAAALLELGVLVYVGVRVADLVGGYRPPGPGLTIVYLVGIALVVPVTGVLAVAERSRWGPVVLGAGALTVCVLFARIDQIWSPGG